MTGDGWTICDRGHAHWGLHGAAGLLLVRRGEVLLDHRAPWVHHGGTWSIPGGARHPDETPEQAAAREAAEEAGITPSDYTITGFHRDDHGGWGYTTVLAATNHVGTPHCRSMETAELRWTPFDHVAALPLHPGFAATWPRLAQLVAGAAAAGAST